MKYLLFILYVVIQLNRIEVAEAHQHYENWLNHEPLYLHHNFSQFSNYPGCGFNLKIYSCRPDYNSIYTYEISTYGVRGWGTRIISSEVSQKHNYCVKLIIRLSVDHYGPGGRVCKERLSAIGVHVRSN